MELVDAKISSLPRFFQHLTWGQEESCLTDHIPFDRSVLSSDGWMGTANEFSVLKWVYLFKATFFFGLFQRKPHGKTTSLGLPGSSFLGSGAGPLMQMPTVSPGAEADGRFVSKWACEVGGSPE